MIILPGLDGTSRMLEGFAATLRTRAGVVSLIAYPRDEVLDYAGLLAYVRKQLPVDSPYVVVGESFSGPIALMLASDPQPNLVGIVLSTTFASAPLPSLAPLASLLRFAPAHPPMAPLSWLLFGPWSTAELRRELRSALAEVSPRVLKARATAALTADFEHLLPAIRCPALVLHATADRLLGQRGRRQLLHGLPLVHVADIEGPHLLLQVAMERCADVVSRFVDRCMGAD